MLMVGNYGESDQNAVNLEPLAVIPTPSTLNRLVSLLS